MMGDPTRLLTHYHDDARTMYEVFQRGLHISGGCYVTQRVQKAEVWVFLSDKVFLSTWRPFIMM